MSQAVKCLIMLAVIALLFVTELIPLAVTAMGGAIACGLLGFIPAKQVFSGLSNSTVVLFAGMFVVGASMFYTGLAQKIGASIVKISGTGEKQFDVWYYACWRRIVRRIIQHWYCSLSAAGCTWYLFCSKDSRFPSIDAFGICLRSRWYHHYGWYSSEYHC